MQIACQNCKKDFLVDERDDMYYKKINVPHPTWCPQCRFTRRFYFQNVWSVYWRNCDKCQARTLSMFHKDNPVKVFCSKCWWADNWDGTEYAMDYDSTRPFFDQLYELSRKTPWVALDTIGSTMVNSEYCNGATWLRNCYLTFWADYCENVAHSSILFKLKDSADCMRMNESELSYESIGQNRAYRVFFSEECDACSDVWFSRNCYNCINCVGCVNLRGTSYQIFNEQYTKEEYAKKIAELKLDSWGGLQALQKNAREFWLTKPYREYSGNSMNVNVSGEYVYESKNSADMFIANGAEDCRYCSMLTVTPTRDSYDYSGWGDTAELMYDTIGGGGKVGRIKFSSYCFPDSLNLEYCIWASSAKNCFGCVNLKRKPYCILNKEYSKEEYEKLRVQIIEDMKKNPWIDEHGRTWTYGEFLPLKIGVFGYNEATISSFIPKVKEEALAHGFSWYDSVPASYTATIPAKDLPETITLAQDTILKEVIGCATCSRGYKIGELEFAILKKLNIPVPHSCPQCRNKARFTRLNPPQLWQRTCTKCGNKITTAFSPERPETVYCGKCYQQEFV